MNNQKFLYALGFIFLLGCSSFKTSENPCVYRCVLAGDLTRYVVGNQDKQGLLEIVNLQPTCNAKSVDIKFRTHFNVWADAPSPFKLEIPYFIAVLDDHENIIDRKAYTLAYKGFGPVDVQTHKASYDLPENFNPSTMRVVIGFALTNLQRQQAALYLEKKRQQAEKNKTSEFYLENKTIN